MNRFVINDLCAVVAESIKGSGCGQRQYLQSSFLQSEALNVPIIEAYRGL